MTPTGPTLARLDQPRGPKTRFAVIADPHLTDHAVGTWKVYHRTIERFVTAIRDADRADVDGIVIAGDLTKDGHPEEFQLARELLAMIDVPFVSVPGNHDVPKAADEHTTPPIEQFERRFGPGPYPRTHRIGTVDIVALNTASTAKGDLYGEHGGLLTPDELDALDRELSIARNPIVVGHHNLYTSREQSGLSQIDGHHPPLQNREAVFSVLGSHDVSLAFTGHNHWPGVAVGKGVTEVACPSTASIPQSYLLVTVEPTGTTVELVPLAGPLGLEEAYQYAANGSTRSRSIAEELHSGYITSFPLVDHGPSAKPLQRPAALERLLQ